MPPESLPFPLLTGNAGGDEGAHALAEMLKHNCRLRGLYLSGTGGGSLFPFLLFWGWGSSPLLPSPVALAEMLKHNCRLIYLSGARKQ